MNNKKVKKLISCICAGSLLLGTIPTNGLVASAAATEKGVTFCDTTGNELEDAKYSLHGVSYDAEEGVFVRMPLEEATKICGKDSVFNKSGVWSLSIYSLAREASGGRIRFNTNSPTITIEAELYTWDAEHVDHGGKSMIGAKYGFDIYEDTAEGSTYVDTVIAETKDENGDGKIDPGSVYISQTIELGDAKERDFTLYFPVVIETRNVKISVAEGSTVKEHVNDYDGNGRIVVYGNSVTQGGCATKPGSTYVNTVARNVNMDFLNLGVWGSCKGQPEFAEYIASIDDMSMLIIDYDGNQSLASALGDTHYPFYEIVRKAHPDIPIIVLTRASNRMSVSNAGNPDNYSTTEEMKAVIRETYETAKAAGDKNIHFVDGETYFGYSKTYMADNAHPDANGQAKMADVVTAAVKEVLAGAENLCVEPSSCKEPTSVLEEDFSGEADATVKPEGWKVASSAIEENSGNCHIATKTDGDVAYQMEFTKGTSASVVTLTPEENVWNGDMNLGVELDAELHIVDGVIPTFGVKIGESPNNKANQKYEVRIEVTEENYIVSFLDGTPGESNPTSAAKSTSVVDQNFIRMYKEGKVSFNLRITQTPTKKDGVEVLVLDVYINDMLVAGYNLKPHEGFEPNSFKLFAYGEGTNHVSVNKVVVDNIKAFATTNHSLSFVQPEGMRAHYVCNECGKKYRDDKGIIQVTDAQLEGNGVTFSDTAGNKLEDAKYSIHGVSYDNDEGIFVRMDLEAAANICNKDSVYDENGEWVKSIYALARESSGGRIRFNTNSPTITIKAELFNWDAAHVSHGGKMEASKYGFDIYEDTADGSIYVDTVVADTETDAKGNVLPGSVYVNQTINLGEAKERNLTIYLPVITETRNVEICVAEGSTVQEHKNGYEGNGRVVFYGNSITQGGSAVKPGSNYVNTTMRNLNLDFINLGMWGSCKGQATFAEYIANLDNVSMLVMDYDGNESRASVLEQRHYPFYAKVRELYPDIPIVLLTRSGNRLQVRNTEDSDYSTTAELREVIRQTYEKAKADGDENIHYVDGETFFGFSYAYLADGVHPTTTGQEKMAEVLTVVLEEVLAGAKNLCVEPNSCKGPTPVLTENFTGEAEGIMKPEGWTLGKLNILDGSLESHVITNEDDNQAYQMKFTKGTSSARVTLTPDDTVWNGEMNLAVEMDVSLYVTDGAIPQFGVKIGETPNNSANQKYEVRVQMAEKRQAVSIYDNTGGGSKPSADPVVTDLFQIKNYINMYKEGKVDFKLKITQTKVRHKGVETLELNAYLDNMLVSGYSLDPQEGFEPNSFKIFCYGAGADGVGVNKAVVDNIKAYVTTTHQLSCVTAEGMREHYVCSECGKKFLDEKAILNVTNADLIIPNKCVDMLFSDDFEDVEQSEGNWTEARTYYPNDGEEGVFGIVEENGNHLYQLLTTRDDKSVSNNISIDDSILTGYPDYTVEAKGVVYKSGSQWPTWSVRLRNPSALGYEVQVQPSASGYKIIVRDRTSTTNTQDPITTVIADKDGNLATQMAAGKVSFNVRVDIKRVVGENNTGKAIFTVYVDDNDPTITTMTLGDPSINVTKAYFYLYTGSAKGLTYKGAVDDVKIYTTSHEISPVEGTTSTESEAGMKAHYACQECGKKFADAEGKTVVTDAQLAYAKLTDILCQTKTNVNNADNTDIRFVVYVDDYQKYQNVTFKITCSAGTGTAICKDAYTGVYAGGQLYTTEDIFGVDGYFATFILKNNTPADLEDIMTVVVTWKALDGTETTKTRIVNISEERK